MCAFKFTHASQYISIMYPYYVCVNCVLSYVMLYAVTTVLPPIFMRGVQCAFIHSGEGRVDYSHNPVSYVTVNYVNQSIYHRFTCMAGVKIPRGQHIAEVKVHDSQMYHCICKSQGLTD